MICNCVYGNEEKNGVIDNVEQGCTFTQLLDIVESLLPRTSIFQIY